MCTGGVSKVKKVWRKIQGKCYFLCALAIVIAYTLPSSDTILAPQNHEVPCLNIVPSGAPIFGLFHNSISNVISSAISLDVTIRGLKVN